MKCENRNWFERYDKRNKLSSIDEESPPSRRWEDMDNEILILIMKRYSWLPSLKTFVSPEKMILVYKDYSFPTRSKEYEYYGVVASHEDTSTYNPYRVAMARRYLEEVLKVENIVDLSWKKLRKV
ncbi:Inosose dehydratase [Bienertia sinuspersici]